MSRDIYMLLYIREISNKDPPFSTENSTQYSVITNMRKESEDEWISMTEATLLYI